MRWAPVIGSTDGRNYAPPGGHGPSPGSSSSKKSSLFGPPVAVCAELSPVVAAVSPKFVLPPEPVCSRRSAKTKRVRHISFLNTPCCIPPYHTSACKSRFGHTYHVSCPRPLFLQMTCDPKYGVCLFRCSSCCTCTLLDPIYPLLVWLPAQASDASQHLVLRRNQGTLLFL